VRAISDPLGSKARRACTLIVQLNVRAPLNRRAIRGGGRGTAVAPAHSDMGEASLRILLVDQNATRAAILEEGLREAGLRDISIVRDTHGLLRRIVDLDPDVIFIDLENPHPDVLEQMFQVSRSVRRPIAMFVDHADTETIRTAVESGISAYVVDGLRKERVKTVLDTAVSHFNAFNKLRDELERANQQLEERKVIERAKGILMKERDLSEDDAYAVLRKAAMNENRRIVDVARGVVSTMGLK
jgi:response regulator NasT